MHDPREHLSARQRHLLESWLPGHTVLASHGWGPVATTVIEVDDRGAQRIVKAGGPTDHHIARELQAHREWLLPWTDAGRAPVLEHGDEQAKLLVTRYLEGELLLDHPRSGDSDLFRQAGELLRRFHDQSVVVDETFERRSNDRAIAWLDGPHRIEPAVVAELRVRISSWPAPPARLVPTHGDWQTRNWLVHGDELRIIDFGRAALRPAMTDFARLAVQEFRENAELEPAFLAGYGHDPRELDPGGWSRTCLREAIGTAAWAFSVGDEEFEAQGHAMIAAAITMPDSA